MSVSRLTARNASHGVIPAILDSINHIILGKREPVKLALCCVLAGGHLLVEDAPGVGKTTLAHAFARTLGLLYQRVQFTSDLLPADVLGVSIYERGSGEFRFHHGPIFSQLILADEINRATPKTQSALLEAMEEQQVTLEGDTHALPKPFFVIATQNPLDQAGTFPLPESQLDRFLMRIHLGHPDPQAERELLQGRDRRALIADIQPVTEAATLLSLQCALDDVHVSGALLDYLQALLQHSRRTAAFGHGLSPRAGFALKRCAQAWAMVHGREHVLPEDVQTILPGVVAHRLQTRDDYHGDAANTAESFLHEVPIP